MKNKIINLINIIITLIIGFFIMDAEQLTKDYWDEYYTTHDTEGKRL